MTRDEIRSAEILRNKMKNVPTERVGGELIISLTSYGERIAAVDRTIDTLLEQTYKADRIVLWLSYDEYPTDRLRQMEKDGSIEIRYCNDILSYKKLTPALKEFPDAYIVTADDDLLYKDSWLATLMACYFNARHKHPNDEFIAAHRCHEIALRDGRTLPYTEWKFIRKGEAIGHFYFQTGGGVLFPPHTLSDEATDERLQMSLSPHCDETFYVACALRKHTPIVTTGRLMPFTQMHYVHGLWNDYNCKEKSETLSRVFGHFKIRVLPKFRPAPDVPDFTKNDELVVLMTTYPPRQEGALKVIRDLQQQTMRPDRVILSLAKSNYPSKASRETLQPFIDMGVEINWVDHDTKTIKQYYPIVGQLHDCVCVSLADDFDYDPNTIRDLYASFCKYGRKYPVSGSMLRWTFDGSNRLSNYGGASMFRPEWCEPHFDNIVRYMLGLKKHNGMKLFVDPMMTYAMVKAGKEYKPCIRNMYVKQSGGWSSGEDYGEKIVKCHDAIKKYLSAAE